MKQITKSNFEQEVLEAKQPILVDFWATWCGPCQMMAPVLAELEEEKSNLLIGKINVDEEPELAMRFKVASIPTLMLFDGGKMKAKIVGYMPKEELCRELEI